MNKFLIYFLLPLIFLSNGYYSQCGQVLQLNNWTAEGGTADWQVNPGGTSVTQAINGAPAFFVSDQDFINVEFSGQFQIPASGDNDAVGFVLGYQDPFNTSTNSDYYLLSIIKNAPNSYGCDNFFGHVTGPTANLDLWNYTSTGTANINTLMCDNTYPGWDLATTYNFTCSYTSTNVTVVINGVTILDVDGCFPLGRFGFYNYSQDNVIYSNFTYNVIADFNFNLSSDSICLGEDVDLNIFCDPTITNPYASMVWDMGDGNTYNNTSVVNHTYQNGGIYTILLTIVDQFGCTDNITKTVEVFDPTFNLGADITDCLNEMPSVTLSVTPPANYSSFSWNTTETTSSITTSTTGLYWAEAIEAQNNCVYRDSINITLNQNPTAAFPLNNVCDGDDYVYTDQSMANQGSLISWKWDFTNDGTFDDISQNTTNTFSTDGSFPSTLVVANDVGCTDTLTQNVTIIELPVASFTFTNECENVATSLSDNSTTATGTINAWAWDYTSDNTIDNNSQNTTNSYGSYGSFNTTLTVTTDQNCSNSITIPVLVDPLPSAIYSASNVCDDEIASFTNNSTIPTGSIISYAWSFDDIGSTSTLQSPTYTYSTNGTFNPTLIVTSDSGCTSTTSAPISVIQNPTADFTFIDGCDQNIAVFTNTSIANGGVITSYKWDYTNDGTTDFTGSNGANIFPSANTYTVELISATLEGCSDTITHDIIIHPNPVANFTSVNICEGNSISFTNTSNIASGSITANDWNFSNGNVSHILSPTELFQNEGIYPINLTVTSNNNCVSQIIIPIEVYPTPVAQFITNDVCENTPVSFTDFSTVSNQYTTNGITNWDWDFGENAASISTSQSPTYTYGGIGIYPVQLITTTNNNCEDTLLINVEVHANPIASFTSTDPEGCNDWCIDFQNTSTISGDAISSYLWTFNNGNVSTDLDPSDCFSNSTLLDVNYDISLAVTSSFGCQSILNEPAYVTVHPTPIADFEASTYESTTFQTEIDFVNNSQIGESYLWDFANLEISTDETPSYTLPNLDSGTYNICLQTTSFYGCVDSICKPIIINGISSVFVPNAFSPDGDGVNDIFTPSLFGVADKDFLFVVFNRWGDLIYQSNAINVTHWDGTYNGVPCQMDTYIWKLTGKDKYNNEDIRRTGHITIIK